MQTGLVSTWAGNPLDIGAMYPFVGGESILVILGLVFWLGWTIWQFRAESADHQEEVEIWNRDRSKKTPL